MVTGMTPRALLVALTVSLAVSAPLPVGASSGATSGERPDKAQALLFATTFGFYEGLALTYLMSEHDLLDGGELVSLGALLTLATTLGSAVVTNYVVDTYGVNRAQTTMFNSSLFWAVLNGATLGVEGDFTATGNITTTLAAGWTGQAMGILLARNVKRTAGQADAMNSAALWSGAEASLLLGALTPKGGSLYLTLGTGIADAALLASAYLVKDSAISSSRVRMFDLGALCGGLAGPAALFMAWGPEDYVRASYLTSIALGIPIGISVAWYLTRDFDRVATVTPAPTGASALSREVGRFIVPLAAGAF